MTMDYICSVCGFEYTLKRLGSNICKKCRKNISNKKYIEGYNGKYMVSNLGRVKSMYDTIGRLKSVRLKSNGYAITELWLNGKSSMVHVHRLVAKAFIDNPDNKPQVNHKNSNRADNCVLNLEWAHSQKIIYTQ